MWNPFRRKQNSLPKPVGGGPWQSLFSVREAYPGAWQQNVKVERRTVLAYHAVFSCMSLIAGDISKMAVSLQRRDSSGIWQQTDNGEVAALLRRPNSFQNRIQFFENWISSKLAHGNTYVIKIRDSAGVVRQLRILDPTRVTPLVTDDGEVFYQVDADNITGIEQAAVVPAREIIHDRFNCLFHPLVGLSPIYACGLSAMQGHHIQENSAAFFKNGGKPSGVITIPGSLSEDKAREIKANWDTSYGGENSGKTALLSDGASYLTVSMTATDAQTVEQLKLTAEIVCSVFHVPAYKVGVGDPPSYNNIEALEQQYYSQCLQTLIESIELLLDEAFDLGSDSGTEFDVSALLRMDTERRMKTLGDAVKNTIMSPNEARLRENLRPVAGGDSLYLQQQNFSLEALARRDAQPDPFGNAPAQEQNPDDGDISGDEENAVKAMVRGMLTK